MRSDFIQLEFIMYIQSLANPEWMAPPRNSENNLLLTDFYMQDWRLYLHGSFDILLNYSISKVGFSWEGGGTFGN